MVPVCIMSEATSFLISKPSDWWHRLRERPGLYYGILLGVLTGAVALLLQNGYWSMGNDSAYYLTLARSFRNGAGYVGARRVPPGWPFFLAGVLSVSWQFWFVNAVLKVLMVAAALGYYLFLSRRIPPKKAFYAVLLASILWWWYRFYYSPFSEALFIPVFVACLLLADRVRDRQVFGWEALSLILLASSLPVIRWAGIVIVPVVCGTLVAGQIKPSLKPNFLCAVAVSVAALASFGVVFRTLNRPGGKAAEQRPRVVYRAPVKEGPIDEGNQQGGQQEAEQQGTGQDSGGQETGGQTNQSEDTQGKGSEKDGGQKGEDGGAQQASHGIWAILAEGSYKRVEQAGQWISGMFWPPLTLGKRFTLWGNFKVRHLANIVGFILWGLALVQVVKLTGRYRWMWGFVLFYSFFLIAIWHPNPRYIIPVAPVLISAIFGGYESIRIRLKKILRGNGDNLLRCSRWILIAGIVAPNLVLLGTSVAVQRSPDYYGSYMAGRYKEIIAAARHLSSEASAEGSIGINRRYLNFGKVVKNKLAARVLLFLTDRRVLFYPPEIDPDGPGPEVAKWAKTYDAEYFLYRPPTNPWRIWHFRMPSLQRWVTGEKNIERNPYWVLYKRTDTGLKRVELSESPAGITSVPRVRAATFPHRENGK